MRFLKWYFRDWKRDDVKLDYILTGVLVVIAVSLLQMIIFGGGN